MPQYTNQHSSWIDCFGGLLKYTRTYYDELQKSSSEKLPQDGQQKWSQLMEEVKVATEANGVVPNMLKQLGNTIEPRLVHGDLALDNIKICNDTAGTVEPYMFSPAPIFAHSECKFSFSPGEP